MYVAYLYGVIRRTRAQVVLAFYEAVSPLFGDLAGRLKDVSFVAAFPGPLWWRQLERLSPGPVHYLVGGEWDRERLSGRGLDPRRIEIIGSLYGSIYRSEQQAEARRPTRRNSKVYDLCIISQVGMADRERQDNVEARLCRFAERFVLESGESFKVAVALRPQVDDAASARETAFFERVLSQLDYDVIPNSGGFSTYEAACAARVTLTHYSTVGFDLMWLGERILFFQESETAYPLPEGISVLVRSGRYEDFETLLRRLLSMPSEEYRRMIESDRMRLAGFGPEDGNPVDAVVRTAMGYLGGSVPSDLRRIAK